MACAPASSPRWRRHMTWLTLSSTAATADSADSGSLLGGVTASVSSLAQLP